MPRPESVTNENIMSWSENIDNDPSISIGLAQSTIIREVMYAGLWLAEKLDELYCPPDLISRIQFTAGRLSFGRDPWLEHQKILDMYAAGQLEFEKEPEEIN